LALLVKKNLARKAVERLSHVVFLSLLA
jgi:hypothetical protein